LEFDLPSHRTQFRGKCPPSAINGTAARTPGIPRRSMIGPALTAATRSTQSGTHAPRIVALRTAHGVCLLQRPRRLPEVLGDAARSILCGRAALSPASRRAPRSATSVTGTVDQMGTSRCRWRISEVMCRSHRNRRWVSRFRCMSLPLRQVAGRAHGGTAPRIMQRTTDH
jgi:hypothetical protein